MPIPIRRPARTRYAFAFAAVLAAALAAFALPGWAASADGKRAPCTADVFRLCSAAAPRVDHVVACLKKERAHLSPACRATVDHKS